MGSYFPKGGHSATQTGLKVQKNNNKKTHICMLQNKHECHKSEQYKHTKHMKICLQYNVTTYLKV